MAKTHFSRAGGQQWVDSFYRMSLNITGDIRYVHAGSGASTGPGFSPETAYATIDQAISACTADNDDAVIVLPDHTESIAGAAGVAQDVAGVRVIGLGVGRNRPRVTFTTADAASWDVSAARCSIENLVLINGRDGQTAMVNVSAADCVIQDCEFMLGDACTQAVLGILTTAGANRMIVRRNHMHGSVDAGVGSAISIVGGDAILVEDNVITGAFTTTGNIANGTASTMLVIRRNHLLNRTADGNNKVIVLHASTTGLIVQNQGGIIDSMCPVPVTAAGAHVGGNHWSSAAGVTASVLM